MLLPRGVIRLKSYELGRGPLARLLEAVQYDIAPQAHKRQAHVWIQDIGPQGAVLGLACWGEAREPELQAWCRARLREHLDERALAAVSFGPLVAQARRAVA
jgi:hypothetical protein